MTSPLQSGLAGGSSRYEFLRNDFEVVSRRAVRPNDEAGKGGVSMKRMRVHFVFDAVGAGAQRHVHLVTGVQRRQHHGAAFLRMAKRIDLRDADN